MCNGFINIFCILSVCLILHDYGTNERVTLKFLGEKLVSVAYSGPGQISKMERFSKIGNG